MNGMKWDEKDFEVFSIEGLEPRMEALISTVRPKLEALGGHFEHYFSSVLGEEFHPHVARHARRKVNPPKDTWVAWSTSSRGYKSLPHFQIGLFGSKVFVILALVYELPGKEMMADRLLEDTELFDSLPGQFIVSGDHMSPEASPVHEDGGDEVIRLLERLKTVKKGEFLVGRHIPREEAVRMSEKEFLALAEDTFDRLLPVYRSLTGRK
ncbi:YktB family protein [Edaphobacillus lindanitolerans]|uniref:UPF0637 protein SAMN05428946_0330 n=1 Tax=Edaphobacillus lindanitolerans TaxID=550447 RepID=A0A1U7PLA7_9BACI|nr:DUF1054 domain-containing protein [Edaphobacillus lindanitolerans]SIT68162.1 Uncharacterized protein YktB, UPF0637 family [Edaphobacillus lindanitolerans]